jgi:hypothetical protein
MAEGTGPDRGTSAAESGLGARDGAGSSGGSAPRDAAGSSGGSSPGDPAPPAPPRDAGSWATKVERLQVGRRAGVRGSNVAGRRLTGPVQGFGKMWQKTYRMDAGPGVSPQSAIATWREHFPEFWPAGNHFQGALTGINPGDVALLDLAVGGRVKLSTGVFVLYADAESFTLMTPQGHIFAGWITFSAERADETTMVQAQVLMRANDPFYEIAMALGGHRKEDRFWTETLTNLGRRLGVTDPGIEARSVCVDSRRQWRNARNIWHNSMVRSVLQTAAGPFLALGRRRGGSGVPGGSGPPGGSAAPAGPGAPPDAGTGDPASRGG